MKKYTLAQRRTLVNAFKKALKTLTECEAGLTSSSPYICDNIYLTSDADAADLATTLIAERIGHVFSIERWLKNQSPEIADAVRDDINNNNGINLQAYRTEWLRKLIVEFEA